MMQDHDQTTNPSIEERLALVRSFSDEIVKRYREKIKTVALFGESLIDRSESARDIDVMVIVDNASGLNESQIDEMESTFDKTAEKISERLSVQPPYTLTSFWHNVRLCNPLVYNILRTGKAVYDVGIFAPIKQLLEDGEIPMSTETIQKLMDSAPGKIRRAKTVKLLMLAEDCYYAIIDSAQALLMSLGIQPPSPSKIHSALTEHLVEKGLLESSYAEWAREIFEIRKKIEQKVILDVPGSLDDEWIDKSERFVKKMNDLLEAPHAKKGKC